MAKSNLITLSLRIDGRKVSQHGIIDGHFFSIDKWCSSCTQILLFPQAQASAVFLVAYLLIVQEKSLFEAFPV